MVYTIGYFLCFHSTKEGFKDYGAPTTRKRFFRFHSTKEGFKGKAGRERGKEGISFHSTKEGFKEQCVQALTFTFTCFHSTKEGFKGSAARQDARKPLHVSIPPRKVSRTERGHRPQEEKHQFPFHQGRFQGRRRLRIHPKGPSVSIPPRKVSRVAQKAGGGDIISGFHSTKEGFKVKLDYILILKHLSFHSTKEGFKGWLCLSKMLLEYGFHSTKEGFKAETLQAVAEVLPEFPFHQGRFQGSEASFRSCGQPLCFHSTKEGFKVAARLKRAVSYNMFPFHQGRFQGGGAIAEVTKYLAFPFHQGRFQGRTRPLGAMTESCFHSTKEGFKAGKNPWTIDWRSVSIPPRKVSRSVAMACAIPPFPVSIPPRKVSRLPAAVRNDHHLEGFHSTKEGFKERSSSTSSLRPSGFHSTKEGFKAHAR